MELLLKLIDSLYFGVIRMGEPWSLLPINGIGNLLSVQWKLENINKIPAEKKKEQLIKLKQALEYRFYLGFQMMP